VLAHKRTHLFEPIFYLSRYLPYIHADRQWPSLGHLKKWHAFFYVEKFKIGLLPLLLMRGSHPNLEVPTSSIACRAIRRPNGTTPSLWLRIESSPLPAAWTRSYPFWITDKIHRLLHFFISAAVVMARHPRAGFNSSISFLRCLLCHLGQVSSYTSCHVESDYWYEGEMKNISNINMQSLEGQRCWHSKVGGCSCLVPRKVKGQLSTIAGAGDHGSWGFTDVPVRISFVSSLHLWRILWLVCNRWVDEV
jgi:hypothetical protein